MKFRRRNSAGSNVELARCGVDQALDKINHRRPSGTTIGVGLDGVRENAGNLDMNGRNRIDAAKQPCAGECRHDHREGRIVGAEIADRVHANSEKPRVGVERQLGTVYLVAALIVGHERLRALAYPFDRPIEVVGGKHDEWRFRIDHGLYAETAANVRGHDTERVLLDSKHF